MIVKVEAGELQVRTADGRVNLVHHSAGSSAAQLAASWRREAAKLRTAIASEPPGRDARARAEALGEQLDACAEALEHLNTGNVMLSLSVLAAHNLGVVLPDYTRQASNAVIADAVTVMAREPVTSADDAAQRGAQWDGRNHAFEGEQIEPYCRQCGGTRAGVQHS